MLNLRDIDSIRLFGRTLEANRQPPYNLDVLGEAKNLLAFLCVDIPDDEGLVVSLTQNRLMQILSSYQRPLWENLSNAYFSGNSDLVVAAMQNLDIQVSDNPMHQASVLLLRNKSNPLSS